MASFSAPLATACQSITVCHGVSGSSLCLDGFLREKCEWAVDERAPDPWLSPCSPGPHPCIRRAVSSFYLPGLAL